MAGFLTELNRVAKAIEREQKAAARRAEQARKADERLVKQLERARATEKKQLEKEANQAHVAAMNAEAERRNLELNEIYSEIDGLLVATLDVDDFVDLEKLRVKVEHPPFDRTDLETPIPPPEPLSDPVKPVYIAPPGPTRFDRAFGGKRHSKAVEGAEARHTEAMADWKEKLAQLELRRNGAAEEHRRAEATRLTELETQRERFASECAAREAEEAKTNEAIDKFISDLGYGTTEAVQEYVSIVLANSVYPDHFPVTNDFSYDPASAELRLRVLVPAPDSLPDIKAYKYTKTKDEITTTSLSQKARKDRYTSAVHQVALRTIHEIYEADRRGLIQTISLEVGTETLQPATGQHAYIPFAAVGCERSLFLEFDLGAIVPSATLEHLGAAVSKNPFGLVAADTKGVRRS